MEEVFWHSPHSWNPVTEIVIRNRVPPSQVLENTKTGLLINSVLWQVGTITRVILQKRVGHGGSRVFLPKPDSLRRAHVHDILLTAQLARLVTEAPDELLVL